MGFSHQRLVVGIQWSLGDGRSPQVTWTLLSTQADLDNTVVHWNCEIILTRIFFFFFFFALMIKT